MSSKKKMFMNTKLSRWNDSITGMKIHRKCGIARHSGAMISNTVIAGNPLFSRKAIHGHEGTCQPTFVLK